MNDYYQTDISLAEKGYLKVSHVLFEAGSLIESDDSKTIPKPDAYDSWRTKRKETYLAGRLAVRHAQASLNLPIVSILKAADGSPNWPVDYLGSISHTDHQAVAVLLLNSHQGVKGIGLDIEDTDKVSLLEDDNIIGTALEFQILSPMVEAKSLARLTLFSLKESVYKALYPLVGVFFDFLDVALIDIKEEVLYFCVLRDLSDAVQKGFIVRSCFSHQDKTLLTWAYW